MEATAKLITSGRTQSIKLPQAFRFPGKTVRLQRTSKGVLILAEKSEKLTFTERRKRFMALAGSCPDLPDVPRPVWPGASARLA